MKNAQASEKLCLFLGGDVMLGRQVNVVIQRQGAAYPLAALAATTRAADLFFVNLECALTPRDLRYSGPEKAFYFRADPAAVETLQRAGVDLVSLANNHALDADYDGLRDTVTILADHGIVSVGAGEDVEAASRPALLEARGMRLGVLAFCDHQPDFAARADRPGTCYTDVSDPETPFRLAQAVAALARRVDHVIVAPVYRSLARRLIEAGARVVWGHSPHHFQGVEWIDGGVVLYATGNLVDDYRLMPAFRNDRQLLFRLVLGAEGVEQVHACPLELGLGQTRAAGAKARKWITRRFTEMCGEFGSRVEQHDAWLHVARPV